MLDIVTMGESMVQLTPTSTGRLRYATRFERFVAGAESNVAIGLTRLGHAAGWVSRVGADEFGACVVSAIRGEGVDVSQVVRDPDARTGVYFKERRQSNATHVHYYRSGSAASRLSPEDLNSDYLAQARYIHLTGITPALSASCRAAVEEALRIAEDTGARVSLDPNIRLRLWAEEEARAALLEMLPRVDVVLASEEEAQLLAEADTPAAAARWLRGRGPECVVVRRGAEGALAVGPSGDEVEEPALSVDVVEPVGAGDAFNAGFLSGQLRGWNLSDSLRLGNVLGGLATTAPGDVQALPTWEEVQAHLGDASIITR